MLATLALHTAVAGVLFFLVFWRHSGLLFNGLDGANMLTNVAFQFAWTTPAAGFFANPLQGLADIWFNFNAWLSPGYALPHMLLGDITVADRTFQASVYAAHAIIFFVAIVVTLRSFGFGWLVGYIATWTTLLLVLPCFGAPAVFPVLQLQPNISFTIAEAFAILAAVSYLGRSDTADTPPIWRDAILIALLVLLAGHFILTSPTSIVLCLPFFLFLTLGLLLGCATQRELFIKIVGIIAVCGALLAAGFGEFLLGIFNFTAAKFSAAHFENSRMSRYFISILFHGEAHGGGGPLLAIFGIAGIFHASIFASGRLAWMARLSLAYIAVMFAFGAMTTTYDFWHGPSPVYFEMMLWPLYAAFAARAAIYVAQSLRGRLTVLHAPSGVSTVFEVCTPARFAAVPSAILLASILVSSPTLQRAYPYPPSRPPLIKTLKKRAGLTLGGPVRGRVVLFQFQGEHKPISWFDIHGADLQRVALTGNDFHLIGLWYHGIPTLDEYAPTLSPALFQAAVQLLARPQDRQLRSVLVLRKMSLRALAVLGVRYVLTDTPAAAPLQLTATEDIDDTQTLRLYEIPGAIEGAASPVSFSGARSFDAALKRLSHPGFDPQEMAILMEPDLQGVDVETLSPAVDVSVHLARNGFAIEAFSPGRSLLVVPVEFSRCLSFKSRESQKPMPRLVRVNALETGILFSGTLSGKLRYFTGPFDGADCRIRDARDFARMLAE